MNSFPGLRLLRAVSAMLLLLGLGTMVAPVGAAGTTGQALLPGGGAASSAEHHDVSPPLRDIPPAINPDTGPIVRPWRKLPRANQPQPKAVTPGGISSHVTANPPALLSNFEAVGQGFVGPAGTFSVSSAPPDPNGAVGPNHYVETVNTDFAVFNKSGTPLYGPVAINTLWNGFGGLCQSDNDGDPVAMYDPIADRWLISQFAISGANGTSTPFLQCVAVSQTADPTGAYNRYSFPYSSFPDYPKFSVWPDGYYVTYNMFNAAGTSFLGGEVCALDRTKMLAGQSATQQCFNVGTNYGGLLASTLDGTRLPPAGAPNHVVSLGTTDASGNGSTLDTWNFHLDWTTPANSTLSGPTALAVSAYQLACNGGTCIPQPGTTQQLDSLADRIMYRLAYRNFGDHEALVVNHAITSGSSVGVRWYELRVAGAALSVFQQGTYAPDSLYRWMGSAAMDQVGNIALGFSASSSQVAPSIRYTGRLATDALGTMTQGEGIVISGGGSQTGSSLSRWGDYTSLAVDPVDGCTFWYTNEYEATSGAFNWHTRVGTFKLPGCGTTPTNDFSIGVSPTSLSLVQNTSGTATVSTAITSGSAQTVALSVSGTPSGATASLNPTSVSSGGSSTLTVNAGTATPGTYTLTITGTGTSATHSTTLSLTVTPSGGGGITNGGFETGTLSGWTSAGSASVTSSVKHSGTYSAMLGLTSPTSGDSSIAQTFSAPSTGGTLSFWYLVTCPDTVTYDWATATLKDNTSNTTATVLAKTCTNTGTWNRVTSTLTGGHSYTLTLISHDDNYTGDPTYTNYDDVAISTAANDFSIGVSPTSLSLVQNTSGTATVSTAITSGSAQTVALSVSGTPSGATASLNPTSVSSGGSSTLTVNAGTATPGTYTLTITGTGTSATHSTTLSLTVTPSGGGGGITNGGFETGTLSGWTSAGSAAVTTSQPHSGTYAAMLGLTSPTNGDSSIAQTFTAPAGKTKVVFWYRNSCPDTVTYDWATATLKDNTTNTTVTVLAKTCTATAVWTQKSATVTAGHSYTLTLISHDDNYPGDPTYTEYDDVALQ